MKNLPAVVAARDGRSRVEVLRFDGSDRVANRDAIGFYFTLRLEPNGEFTRVGVIFSGTVMVVSPEAFGLPDEGEREANFVNFSLAALGDYLETEGLPPVIGTGKPAHHIECFSPHFQGWMDRDPAGDDEIEAYLRVHAFAAWEYGHDQWELGPSDMIRLNQSMKAVNRLILLGKDEDWEVFDATDSSAQIKPTADFIRRMRKGDVAPARKPPVQQGEELTTAPEQVRDEGPSFVYVDEARIAELRSISTDEFDLRKLVALCEELNVCYRSQCYHAVAALTRALLDHTPPLLGEGSFSEIANNYAGTKSFKECMQRLEGAGRKIADGHLHTRIRKKESLPTRTQVNFSNEVDVLLAEIVRVVS